MTRTAPLLLTFLIVLLAAAAPAGATYRGDNGRLAVAFASGGEPSALYTMNPDGSERVRLTAPGRAVFDPSWSADGSKIVFQAATDAGMDLFMVDADGTDEVRLTTDGKSLHPALSPDGRNIAFVHDQYPSYVAIVMRLDGSERRGYGAASPFDGPNFSPNGGYIAFSRSAFSRPDSNGVRRQTFRIVAASLAGTGEGTLTPESVRAHGPSYAPNGQRIVYSSDDGALHLVDIDGTGGSELPDTGGELADSDPVFSPDGRRIAFGSGSDVRVVDADGSNPRVVPLGASASADVDWQPLPLTTPPPAPACSAIVVGNSRANRIVGSSGGDRIRGMAGDDRISGGGGADCLFGGLDDDVITGGSGDDRLEGYRGDDVLNGGTGRDRFDGGTGRDRIRARDGVREVVDCGASTDTAVVDRTDIVRRCERVLR